jgi:hypothetical protein
MEIAFNVDESAISPDDRLGVISIIAIASRTIELLRAMEREGQSVPDRRVGQPAHHKLGYHRFPSPEDAAMREANGEFDLC